MPKPWADPPALKHMDGQFILGYRQAQTDAMEYIDRLCAVIEDLKITAIAFAAPTMAQRAREYGLPDGHLLPAHYDLLASLGARMVDSTRGKMPDAKPD